MTNSRPIRPAFASSPREAFQPIRALAHSSALLAFIAPTTNSYKRLVPGFEAPVNLAYSMRNRSCCARIPAYFATPESRRIEFRLPDPTCNPYLGFPAMLMAGIDGIINKIDPGEPMDMDLYSLSPEQSAKVSQVPGSLDVVLDALEQDYEFLYGAGVKAIFGPGTNIPDAAQDILKLIREARG